MKIDLDYSEAHPGLVLPPTEKSLALLSEIVEKVCNLSLNDFAEAEIRTLLGRKKKIDILLDRLWKAGLIRKLEANDPNTRPKAKWTINGRAGAIIRALPGDPEIHRLLQERARRELAHLQADRLPRRRGTLHGPLSRPLIPKRRRLY
jgi:hypothetical protein